MFRNLCPILCLCLSACIVYVESPPSSPSHHYSDDPPTVAVPRTGDLHSACYEDYGDVYDWHFEMWSNHHVEWIDLYINSWKWVPMERVGATYGEQGYYWEGTLLNTYFYCDNSYEFEVVVEDYAGNVTYHMFYW